jgi:hypothetical protein
MEKPAQDLPDIELPFTEPFVFVVGNQFQHKAVDVAVSHLPPTLPAVILGSAKHAAGTERNRAYLQSGKINHAVIDALYRKCSLVIFPSQYEGFGLPLLHAAVRGKPVIACDTEITRELLTAFSLEQHLHRFQAFEELPALIARAMSAPPPPLCSVRTWDEAAMETIDFLKHILQQPIDIAHLERRFTRLSFLEMKHLAQAAGVKKGILRQGHQWLASFTGRKLNRFPRTKKRLTRMAAALRILP